MTLTDGGDERPEQSAADDRRPTGSTRRGGRGRSRRGQEWTRDPIRPHQHREGLQLQRAPDYLIVGHICADLLPDGKVVLGGTALYSGLAAARLGWRVGVLTRGVFGREVHGVKVPSLDRYADELSIICQDADETTTFINEYHGDQRIQTMPHWAGPIDLNGIPPHWRRAKVVHLGPVADEIEPRQVSSLQAGFLGATPQGWMRQWPRKTGGRVTHVPLRLPPSLISQLDSVVVSIGELPYTREVVDRVGERRLAAVTLDENGARIIYGGQQAELPAFPIQVRDQTGAGDVFAAAFFIKASDRTVSAKTAGRFANAVAALSLREVGPNGAPQLAEVQALLEE
jgi:sugar/nucleoside kinase (ribokinase family)